MKIRLKIFINFLKKCLTHTVANAIIIEQSANGPVAQLVRAHP